MPLAALTADAAKIALTDPSDKSRVDAWDASGTHLGGLIPYDPQTPVEWLGWSSKGVLLTLAAGKLTGWQLPAAKAIYEVDGGYERTALLGPGHQWLALTCGKHVDIIDAETGRCLGRCEPKVRRYWFATKLSPDGRNLVRLGPGEPTSPNNPHRIAATVWDLTSGKEAASFQFGLLPFRGVAWAGPCRLVCSATYQQLIDLDALGVVADYKWPKFYSPPSDDVTRQDLEAFRSDPAGRLWVSVDDRGASGRVWQAVSVPSANGPDAVIAREGLEYPFRPGSTLRVEANLGARRAAWPWRKILPPCLRARGSGLVQTPGPCA